MSEKPLFRIIKGNPDPTQVAALTTVLASLAQQAADRARADAAPRERNRWGALDQRLHDSQLYNPNAFKNLTYR
ncbi:acyl-CoA carboxylase subunit epsilon [Corynebacterium halotolerans]|uniref:acyl-CoA carboxylase subunit epsilon n=1 Tax=Corynebacterium halotolerans TaxID=225326 RepID=UPI003CF40717